MRILASSRDGGEITGTESQLRFILQPPTYPLQSPDLKLSEEVLPPFPKRKTRQNGTRAPTKSMQTGTTTTNKRH